MKASAGTQKLTEVLNSKRIPLIGGGHLLLEADDLQKLPHDAWRVLHGFLACAGLAFWPKQE